MRNTSRRNQRVLAVASGGGHWVQLLRLRPAFAGAAVAYATVNASSRNDIAAARFYRIPDANRSQKARLLLLIVRLAFVVVRVRPHVIVTTGAAPGYIAIRLGRILGARTVFLDSMANAEKLSLSAHLAERHADLLLTQWEHLAKAGGPQYHGSVV